MRKILLVLGFLAIIRLLPAQSPHSLCLTPDTRLEWVRHFQKKGIKTARLRSETKYLPITLHIVRDNQGEGGLSMSRILDAFCVLNNDYADTGIQFFINDTRYINSSRYAAHKNLQEGANLIQQNEVAGTVNVFFVEKAVYEDACGYTLINSQQNLTFGIVLANSCTHGSNSNWSHEMGHYLSLPHTFHGWEGVEHNFSEAAPASVSLTPVELASGENCRTAGDGFCDTPADYLNGRWYCDNEGQSLIQQFDPKGVPFSSDGTLIMSYSFDGCANRFSPEQIATMHAFIEEKKKDHLYSMPDFHTISAHEIELTNPVSGAFYQHYDQIMFQWEPVYNATGYIVEISFLPNFAVIDKQYYTRKNELMVEDLSPSRSYYWRIRPFNEMYTCKVFSFSRAFVTGTVTGTNELLQGMEELQISPNPAPAGTTLNIDISSARPMELHLRLLDIRGTVQWQGNWACPAGDSRKSLPLSDVSSGMYYLQLSSETAAISRKVLLLSR